MLNPLSSRLFGILSLLLTMPLGAQPLPNNARFAVSLSYDDALISQLDLAVPALNRHGFHASFYIFPAADGFAANLERWRALPQQGHELGNHTLYHVCAHSANRTWVQPHADLNRRTVEAMRQEVRLANTFLQALDGKTDRTLTPPCFDSQATDGNYVDAVRDLFVAVKGQGVDDGSEVLHFPAGISAEHLIELVREVDPSVQVISLLFHGVGGDHSAVSVQAHDALLDYLAANRDLYWVDTYLNIMRHLESGQSL